MQAAYPSIYYPLYMIFYPIFRTVIEYCIYILHAVYKTLLPCAILFTTACSVLPEPPAPATVYDFGPTPVAATAVGTQRPAIVLANINNATSQPEGSTALLYRLVYSNAQQLHPYTRARWSQPPTQLLQHTVRQRLAQQRIILQGREGLNQQLPGNGPEPSWPAVLRIELEEFSHLFSRPDSSAALVRLNATLSQPSPTGETLVAQRSFTVQQPAASHDAAGGAQALAVSAAQVAEDIAQWLEEIQQ